jgi:hypothetical protein
MMRDLWNPSPDNVRAWARDPESMEPVQDWDLVLATARHDKAYLELASDPDCPTRVYFLQILYLIVGDAVRTGFRTADRSDIEALLTRGAAYSHPDIGRWRQRSTDLLAHPEAFSYDEWCAGGLARAPAV